MVAQGISVVIVIIDTDKLGLSAGGYKVVSIVDFGTNSIKNERNFTVRPSHFHPASSLHWAHMVQGSVAPQSLHSKKSYI